MIAAVQLGLSRYGNQVLYAATSGGPRVVAAVVWALALAAFVLSLVGWTRRS